eukprot:CAMPEP_0117674916 /NCGR_PEP_ID=MMETSP0804-20121206/15315_1 /TAXON_ID=1074897 /ORGANISM="Tetraselmis astigmatica, Strain CCMP880" /LENGTH=247 /DNA_ID=CAMNT_0005483861 /DNA_START=56 /DNA_END=799 /DNA_ORIENTATION=+
MAFQQVSMLRIRLPSACRHAGGAIGVVPSLRASTLAARPVFQGLAGSSPSPSTLRSFAASAASDDLAAVLKSELSQEREDFEEAEDLKTVPGGYAITKDAAGDGEVILSKKQGNEEIFISFEVNNQPDPEPLEDPDEPEVDMLAEKVFLVSVEKGDQTLTFECRTNGDGVMVDHMAIEPKDGYEEDSTMYTGPVYEELDERVHAKVEQYLSERYVYDLAPFIFQYIDEKEQNLYMEWLERTSKFLES